MTTQDGDATMEPAGEIEGTASSPLESGIGSRTHIRQTLDRSRLAIKAARERTRSSSSLLARSEALVGASAILVQASLAIRAELRASVTAYARHLRTDGVPPERMLVLVKSAVREATPAELDAVEARDLMEDVVRWSIDAYYHAA
jgi:hypothetical protein